MTGLAWKRTRLPAAMLFALLIGGCASTPLDVPGCPTGAQVDELVKRYLRSSRRRTRRPR